MITVRVTQTQTSEQIQYCTIKNNSEGNHWNYLRLCMNLSLNVVASSSELQ